MKRENRNAGTTWLSSIQKVKYGLRRNLVSTLRWCPFQALNKMTIFSRFYQWTSTIMRTLHQENSSKQKYQWETEKVETISLKNGKHNILTGATTKAPAFSVIKSLQTSLFFLEDLRCFWECKNNHDEERKIQSLFIIIYNFLKKRW